jgi:hypothetical protein
LASASFAPGLSSSRNGWTCAGSSDRRADKSRKLYSAVAGVDWREDALGFVEAASMGPIVRAYQMLSRVIKASCGWICSEAPQSACDGKSAKGRGHTCFQCGSLLLRRQDRNFGAHVVGVATVRSPLAIRLCGMARRRSKSGFHDPLPSLCNGRTVSLAASHHRGEAITPVRGNRSSGSKLA